MNYSWKLDNFDTIIFGFKVAKIVDIDPTGSAKVVKDRIRNLLRELIKNRILYATFRTKSSNFELIHSLEESNFILVDGLITLEINTLTLDHKEQTNEIRKANRNDLKKLKELTSGVYSSGRIFNDPLISKNIANTFYMKWIENSIVGNAADLVLVWEEKADILGYVTLQKKGKIPLVCVSKKARGKGIASRLINASFNAFKKWDVKNVVIETQMDNIPALRIYQSCGFKIIGSYVTFRWKNDIV